MADVNSLYFQNPDEKCFQEVRDFYWKLIDKMQPSEYLPGWENGVYPTDNFLLESLRNGELYVLRLVNHTLHPIIAAMILNHSCNDGYSGTAWGVDAPNDEVLVIHALGTMPGYQNAGVATRLVQESIRIATEAGQQAIRLDVLGGNVPAAKLYESCGFQHRRAVQMLYADTGWTEYWLYELVLK